jgi:hypothetical protein
MAHWWWKADYFETCNCEYGCPCNTTSIPTDGTCQAINAWQIREGAYDDVRLDGVTVALISRWPNPIHEGNGRGVAFVDDRADDAQREALGKICRGEAGPGGPFEVFNSTYVEPAGVVSGPIEISRDGKRGSLRLGNAARAEWEPVRSRMDGSEADVYLTIPGGFIFTNGEIVSSKLCEVDVGGLTFQHENSSGFFDRVEYNV